MADISAGLTFEARAQRLFLAQGSFAERGLLPTATPDRRMLATDIDVLVSEYGSGFHLTRRHVECKSGKFSLLDRILWLNGVRTLLRADSSYLIAVDIDLSASAFARGLDVQLFTEQHLNAWEKALGIPANSWPCRSDCATFDSARRQWKQLSTGKTDGVWRLLRGALAFVEVDSWLTFQYRHLNKLFRLIGEVSKIHDSGELDRDQQLCARYVFSALLVRFSQYSLAICADVGGIMPLEVKKHLSNRLTFGDQDPTQVADLTTATVAWVSQGLHAKGITMPSEIDPARLRVAPPYTAEMVSLIHRVLAQSHEARYLPLAVERMQFGLEADDKLPRFRAAAASADTLAVLLKAFVARTFRVPNALATPVHADLMGAYVTSRTAGPTPAPTSRSRRSKWSDGHPRDKGMEPKPTPVQVPSDAAGEETPSKAAPDPPKAAQANLLTMQADEKDPVLSAPTSHVPPIAPGPPRSKTPGGVSTETPGLRDRSRPEGGDRLRPARDDTMGAVIADDEERRRRQLEQEFHEAMLTIYRRAKTEAKYPAHRFIGMVEDKGGLKTAQYLLDTPNVSVGYTALWERKRLDLTVEAVILEEKWRPLFTLTQRRTAITRLREHKYDRALPDIDVG